MGRSAPFNQLLKLLNVYNSVYICTELYKYAQLWNGYYKIY